MDLRHAHESNRSLVKVHLQSFRSMHNQNLKLNDPPDMKNIGMPEVNYLLHPELMTSLCSLQS